MTDAELERLMNKVLVDAVALDAESIKDTENAFQPSRHHSTQMRYMLKDPLGWAKKQNQTRLQIIGKWVAVLLLFISLSFGLVMLFSAPVRAAVERWVVEWYQIHIIYRYSGKAESVPRYELTSLPEGFVELERMEESTFTDVVYGNDAGELVFFSYAVMTQGGATVFIPNGDVVSEVMVGKDHGMLLIPQTPGNMNTLTWTNEKDNIQFTIAAEMDESDMIGLAESLQQKKK